MPYLYLQSNIDWSNNNKKYKYGYCIDLKNRLHDSHDQFSEKKKYIYAVEVSREGFPETIDIDTIFKSAF
tara:strand:- start:354 stop:563 length:210 start_codon:yes stop_codon:yes gene_type:complete